MDYHDAQSLAFKIQTALYEFKPEKVKCIVCQTVREQVPDRINLIPVQGEVKVVFVGTRFVGEDWVDLYDADFDGAQIAAVCRDCAIRRGIVKEEPDQAEASAPVGPVKESGPNPSF